MNISLGARLDTVFGKTKVQAIICTVLGIVALLSCWGVVVHRDHARRIESANNLRQIGVALYKYHDAVGYFPSDAGSQLSWRVQILPHLGENALYERFQHDEPWDSPHNIRLLPLMPKIYRCPRWPVPGDGLTYYQSIARANGVLNVPGGVNALAMTEG
jgi:hypothetical protein